MSIEASGLPVGGGAFAAALGIGAVFYFAVGPFVGGRVIEFSGWQSQCKRMIAVKLEADKPAPTFTPRFNCNALSMLFPGMERVCRQHGNPELKIPFMDQLAEIENRRNQIKNRRLDQAASASASRCECASSLAIESNKSPLAIWSATGRLVEPLAVKNSLRPALLSALNSPRCAAIGEIK